MRDDGTGDEDARPLIRLRSRLTISRSPSEKSKIC
jgi:hypothetical protein